MTGFNNAAVDEAFFPSGLVKSNVLINIGYGDAVKLFPRSPRLAFGEIAIGRFRTTLDAAREAREPASGRLRLARLIIGFTLSLAVIRDNLAAK